MSASSPPTLIACPSIRLGWAYNSSPKHRSTTLQRPPDFRRKKNRYDFPRTTLTVATRPDDSDKYEAKRLPFPVRLAFPTIVKQSNWTIATSGVDHKIGKHRGQPYAACSIHVGKPSHLSKRARRKNKK